MAQRATGSRWAIREACGAERCRKATAQNPTYRGNRRDAEDAEKGAEKATEGAGNTENQRSDNGGDAQPENDDRGRQ